MQMNLYKQQNCMDSYEEVQKQEASSYSWAK